MMLTSFWGKNCSVLGLLSHLYSQSLDPSPTLVSFMVLWVLQLYLRLEPWEVFLYTFRLARTFANDRTVEKKIIKQL